MYDDFLRQEQRDWVRHLFAGFNVTAFGLKSVATCQQQGCQAAKEYRQIYFSYIHLFQSLPNFG